MLFKMYHVLFLHKMQVYWPKLVFDDVGTPWTPNPLASANVGHEGYPSPLGESIHFQMNSGKYWKKYYASNMHIWQSLFYLTFFLFMYDIKDFIKLFKCRFTIGTLDTLYIAPLNCHWYCLKIKEVDLGFLVIPEMVLPISVINLWPMDPNDPKVSTTIGTKW